MALTFKRAPLSFKNLSLNLLLTFMFLSQLRLSLLEYECQKFNNCPMGLCQTLMVRLVGNMLVPCQFCCQSALPEEENFFSPHVGAHGKLHRINCQRHVSVMRVLLYTVTFHVFKCV